MTDISPAAPPTADPAPLDRRFSVAPMMDWTDRHCRTLHRQITHRALLFTEMVTTGALIHGEAARFLGFSPAESPLALQLGGSEPADLARCAKLAESWGYDEVNLNCGCPSPRVQKGSFGACLMLDPALVADCVKAMIDATDLPVTVKHRIGVDDHGGDAWLFDFIAPVAEAGCRTFYVHARAAWLKGLSPKENREVPPLDHAVVSRIKSAFPALEVIVNGGIESLAQAEALAACCDGVMLGRAAWRDPFLMSDVDRLFYGSEQEAPTRLQVFDAYAEYVDSELARGTRLHTLIKPLLGLFHGQRGGRKFRQILSEGSTRPGADRTLMAAARAAVAD